MAEMREIVTVRTFDNRRLEVGFRQVVEMGGWDFQYFNKVMPSVYAPERYDRMWEVNSAFFMVGFREFWNQAENVIQEFEERVVTLDDDIEFGRLGEEYAINRTSSVELIADEVIMEKADYWANELLSFIGDDSIAALYTQGGCYKFEEPAVRLTIREDGNRVLSGMSMHLFRFYTNLFISTLLLYMDDRPLDFEASVLETQADALRRYGESP